MKKTVLILSVLLIAGFGLQVSAHPVDTAAARTVAIHYLQWIVDNQTPQSLAPQGRRPQFGQPPLKGGNGGDRSVEYSSLTDVSSSLPFTEFYTFTFNNGNGFILVAADDCVTPILGYSLTNGISLDKMPENLYSWLEGYDGEIARIKNENGSRKQGGPRARGTVPDDMPKTVYGPLIETAWNQAPYYNALCPSGGMGQRTMAGCVAVAGAQVMKYWNHPATGYGSHSYYRYGYGTLSADFGATAYDWSHMPDSLNALSTTTEKNAVATLIYHVGVAVEMNYGVDFSGAFTNVGFGVTQPTLEEALVRTFKYVPTLHTEHRADYSTEQWKEILVTELSNSRPVIYSGSNTESGHAFICDGYNSSTDMFHFNWGWGGAYDGWFVITDLHPEGSGIGGNSTNSFNLNNRAIVGIQPNYSFGGSTTVTLTINDSTMGSVTGGGSYAFGDTISLLAIANPGHRFVHWDVFEKHNSCYTIATGGNYTVGAVFEALSGDTLHYCTGDVMSYLRSIDTAAGTRWGIRLPASTLTAGHDLTMVQFYPGGAGPYELTVYVGGTADSDAVYSATCHVSEVNGDRWNTIVLATPVAVTGGEDIYITFYNNTIAYPAAFTYGSGNSDGILMGGDFTDITGDGGYSLMIKGIFQGGGGDSLGLICPDVVRTDVPAVFRAVAPAGSTVTWSLPYATPATAIGDSVSATWTEPGTYAISATAATAGGSTTRYYIVEVSDCHLVVEGDTVSYVGGGAFVGASGFENVGLHWGVKIPARHLSQVDTLGAVLLYVCHPAHYTLSLSQGDRPGTPLYTQTYYFFNTNAYNVCPLPVAFVPDPSEDLWITFHCSDVSYPAAYTSYADDANSCWFSGDGEGWGQIYSCSWMIKVVTGTPAPAPPAVVVGGPRAVAVGEEHTYHATTEQEATVTWSLPGATVTSTGQPTGFTSQVTALWPAAGTYPVIATAANAAGSASDTLYVNVVQCSDIETLPYTFDFEDESSLACWTVIDADGDGHCWGRWDHGYNSGQSAYSASYAGSQALLPDNWLVSPPVVLPPRSHVTLSWMEGSYHPAYYAEHYAVYISTAGTDPSDFVPLMEHTLDSCNWAAQRLTLDSYAGQTVRIAFRHFGCTDICHLYIDDITVNAAPANGIESGSADVPVRITAKDGCIVVEGAADEVQVYDIVGRQILHEEIHSSFFILHSSLSTPGVYLVKVTSGHSTATKKLLVR